MNKNDPISLQEFSDLLIDLVKSLTPAEKEDWRNALIAYGMGESITERVN